MTHLSLDDVVALNALIVTAIGLSFAFGRKDRKPLGLNLKGRRSTAYDEIPFEQRVNHLDEHTNMKPRATRNSPRNASRNSYGAVALQRLEHDELLGVSSQVSRQLNVFFNWNGHTWDAYEVLGIPAGAGRETVVSAFHACRAKNPDSTAFLQAATDAILKR